MPNRPTPDAIRKLSGSHLERLNKKSPTFRRLEAVPTLKHVARDKYALAEWESLVPELVTQGLLNRANLSLLGDVCMFFAEARHAEDDVVENGRWCLEPVFNKNGDHVNDRRKPNPAISQAHHARLGMLRCMIEFGMTPASATRVSASPDDGSQESFDDFDVPEGEDEKPPKQLAN